MMEISTRGWVLGAVAGGVGGGGLAGLGIEETGTKLKGSWVEKSGRVGGMVLKARGDSEE
jgi:hypothetical protein